MGDAESDLLDMVAEKCHAGVGWGLRPTLEQMHLLAVRADPREAFVPSSLDAASEIVGPLPEDMTAKVD